MIRSAIPQHSIDVRDITQQPAWEALADRLYAPMPQRWLYGETAQRIGRKVHRFCIFDTSEGKDIPIAIAQVIMRTHFGMQTSLITRGPLFLPDVLLCTAQIAAQIAALRRALRRSLPSGIKLMTPEVPLGRLKLSATPEVVELDLSQSLEALRAGMHGKWRNALKKAESARLKVAQLQPAPTMILPLLRVEKERQTAGRYRGLPPEFILAIQNVAPKSLRLYTASDAQMLFVVHGNTATYQIGHSGPEGRAVNAHNLILWDAIRRLKSEGVLRLDLGTIDRDKAANLARFKLRSGATARKLAPATLL